MKPTLEQTRKLMALIEAEYNRKKASTADGFTEKEVKDFNELLKYTITEEYKERFRRGLI